MGKKKGQGTDEASKAVDIGETKRASIFGTGRARDETLATAMKKVDISERDAAPADQAKAKTNSTGQSGDGAT